MTNPTTLERAHREPRVIMTKPRGDRPNPTSDFTDLARTIRDAGLLERRRGWYLARGAILAVASIVAVGLLFVLGNSWWQLLLAVGFAILFTQIAFLTHDGAHRQIFASGKKNEWFTRVVANAVVGLSYGWWMVKHSRHHANPNKMGQDGDIDPGALVFTIDDGRKRTGIAHWLAARQGWFFFPILTMAGLDLHITSFKTVLAGDNLKHRVIEMILLVVRLLGFPALLVLAMGPWMALAFLVVQVAAFGMYMGGSFAPNHKGMPIVPADAKIDFLRRQVLMSRNIRRSPVTDIGMGGLNYQIEHHLFPNMPSINLRAAQPIVRAYCAERDVQYTETTLIGSYGIVVRYLNQVGLAHQDPFECPLASQLRTA